MSTQSPSRTLTVAIATPIDAAHVEPIRAIGEGVEVLYEPDLLPALRYPGDHRGVEGFTRDADGERRWQEMLQSAEVLLGLPGDSPEGLAAVVRSNPGLPPHSRSVGARERAYRRAVHREPAPLPTWR